MTAIELDAIAIYANARGNWVLATTPFDGASTWTTAEGQRITRVIRRSSDSRKLVDVVDVDGAAS